MTVFIFVGGLLGAMALGIPIAYALLASGVALMLHLDMFDAQNHRLPTREAETCQGTQG